MKKVVIIAFVVAIAVGLGVWTMSGGSSKASAPVVQSVVPVRNATVGELPSGGAVTRVSFMY